MASRSTTNKLNQMQDPPLYLHITSTTKEGLEKAVKKIEDLMSQELPNLIDERRFKRRDEPQQPQVERDELGRVCICPLNPLQAKLSINLQRKWPEEHIPIDLEPIPGFNLRAKVVGQGGQNVKYIQEKTGCKVQIKGRGSGFIEHNTSAESDEPMYLSIAYVLHILSSNKINNRLIFLTVDLVPKWSPKPRSTPKNF